MYTNTLSVIGAKQIATCTKNLVALQLYDNIIKFCSCAVPAINTARGCRDSVRLIRVQRTRLIYNLPYNK